MNKLFRFLPGAIGGLVLGAMLLYFSGCATLQNLIGQPQLQTYTFIYNAYEYSVLLPKEVPTPPEKSQLVPESYLEGIYAMHIWYMGGEESELRMPVASFWFTLDLGVVGLVWHTLKSDGTTEHKLFLYVKGIPIPTQRAPFNKFLKELKGKYINLTERA